MSSACGSEHLRKQGIQAGAARSVWVYHIWQLFLHPCKTAIFCQNLQHTHCGCVVRVDLRHKELGATNDDVERMRQLACTAGTPHTHPYLNTRVHTHTHTHKHTHTQTQTRTHVHKYTREHTFVHAHWNRYVPPTLPKYTHQSHTQLPPQPLCFDLLLPELSFQLLLPTLCLQHKHTYIHKPIRTYVKQCCKTTQAKKQLVILYHMTLRWLIDLYTLLLSYCTAKNMQASMIVRQNGLQAQNRHSCFAPLFGLSSLAVFELQI